MKIPLTPTLRIGINLEMVPDAGHHIYADQASFFNNAVNKALGDSSESSKEPSAVNRPLLNAFPLILSNEVSL